MIKSKIFLFILLIFAGGVVVGQATNEADKATLLINNQQVPSFKFESSKGKVVSFNARPNLE